MKPSTDSIHHFITLLVQGYLTAPLVADYARNIRTAAFDTRYPRYVCEYRAAAQT